MDNKMEKGAANLAGTMQEQPDRSLELDATVTQPLSDEDAELVGDLGNDADDELVMREIDRITSSAELWRRFGPTLRALDRQRYVFAAARMRELRIAAIEAALAMKRKPKPAPMVEPNWQDIWDATEREAERRSRAFEPDECDPASPEANPEIAEWEAHWPSHEPDSAPTPNPSPAEPCIEIVIRGLKRMTRRK
jgi:hypothetical protein